MPVSLVTAGPKPWRCPVGAQAPDREDENDDGRDGHNNSRDDRHPRRNLIKPIWL
jgi:hypothetical protein